MDVVEIRLCAGDLLHLRGLASCIRVNRLWYETYIPFLYRAAHNSTFHDHQPSFERHLHLVRDLEVPFYSQSVLLKKILASCKHLRQLSVPPFTMYDDEVSLLVSLLKENPQLVRLELLNDNQTRTACKWLLDAAVENCPRLSSLRLVSLDLEGELLNPVLAISSRLKKLEVSYCLNLTKEIPWKDWPEFPELKELRADNTHSVLAPHDQLRLFRKCPKLETITWGPFKSSDGDLHASEFVTVLCALLLRGDEKQDNGSSCWPRLHSVCFLEGCPLLSSSDAELANLLRSCPTNLRRLEFPLVESGPSATQALRRHWGSLQVLHLITDSAAIQEILSSCHQLVEFRGAT